MTAAYISERKYKRESQKPKIGKRNLRKNAVVFTQEIKERPLKKLQPALLTSIRTNFKETGIALKMNNFYNWLCYS